MRVKPAVFYRISAVLLLLFATLHTVGFLTFKPPTAEGMAVRAAMTNVHFEIGGASLSFDDFYRGFGLFVTLYFLFAAFVAWTLASHPVRALGWALCVVQAGCLVLAWIFFAMPQIAFSLVVVATLVCAAWPQAVTRN